MLIKSKLLFNFLLALNVVLAIETMAIGTKLVKDGVVIRGVELSGPVGISGTTTGKPCNFSKENVDQNGNMIGVSVNCQPTKRVVQQVLVGLPTRFNAYCVRSAPVSGARLIQAKLPENGNHCDLSGIKPKEAEKQFGGSVWR